MAIDLTTEQRLDISRSTTLTGWSVLLWNDDHNAMDAVVRALVGIVGLAPERAMDIMMEAHTEGKAVAWTGAKEVAEAYRDGLEGHGLTATIAR